MRSIFLCALLFLVSGPAFAQTLVWTPPHTVDSGWFLPNPNGCTPVENEPTEWDRLQVPLPPDGADLVRTTIDRCEYRLTTSITNLAAEPLGYGISGLYRYRIGHIPGIYGIPLPGGYGETGYATGLGWNALGNSDPRYVMQCGAGGGFSYNSVPPGLTEEAVYTRMYDAGPDSTMGCEVRLVTPEWMTPNRRGAHSLFVTTTGEPTLTWYIPGSWHESHNPWSAGVAEEVRIQVTVEYGSWN